MLLLSQLSGAGNCGWKGRSEGSVGGEGFFPFVKKVTVVMMMMMVVLMVFMMMLMVMVLPIVEAVMTIILKLGVH